MVNGAIVAVAASVAANQTVQRLAEARKTKDAAVAKARCHPQGAECACVEWLPSGERGEKCAASCGHLRLQAQYR